MRPTIEQLIQQPEDKRLERKRDLSSPRNVMKTLVAFANSAGGCIVIGVEDDHRVVGVVDPLSEEERLCNLIADHIAPPLVPNIEIATIGESSLLIIEVFPSNSRPHYLKQFGPDQGVYVRLGSSNRQAAPELIAELRRSAQGIIFDELPMPDLTIADLDLAAAQRLFGRERQLDESSATTLKLLRHEQGRLVPTQGGVLLFGKEREYYFPDAWVQCGRFRGTDKVEIFDQTEIHEHLPVAVTAIEMFLKKHAFKTARFGQMRREDVWSIPLTILREAIVNALIHCDYSMRGAPVRVAFFDDRIDIESPGLLLPGMSVEDMRNGVSRIRNPVIARVFRELHLIEQWGSGVKRIFNEAAEQGLPEPSITESITGVRLSIYLREPVRANGDNFKQLPTMIKDSDNQWICHPPGVPSVEALNSRGVRPSQGPVKAQSRPSQGPVKAQSQGLAASLETLPTESLEKRIVDLVATREMSARELVCALGLPSKSGAFKRAIVRLLESGIIVYTVPEKPTSRLQKYRLCRPT